jgi:hypothetical protein
MQELVTDYQQFGIENIWILDPATRKGFDCRLSGWLDATEFEIANTPIHVSLPGIFARIRR